MMRKVNWIRQSGWHWNKKNIYHYLLKYIYIILLEWKIISQLVLLRLTSGGAERGGRLTGLPWLVGWTRWAWRRGRTRGPKTLPRLLWWSSDPGASPWPTTPLTALKRIETPSPVRTHIKGQQRQRGAERSQWTTFCDCAYGHEPSWAPRDAGRTRCWKCSPDSTLWCEWPGAGAHLQSQTVKQYK